VTALGQPCHRTHAELDLPEQATVHGFTADSLPALAGRGFARAELRDKDAVRDALDAPPAR